MHYLITGGGAAGLNCIEGIRKIDSQGEITLVCKEKYLPYARCLITDYLVGNISEDVILLRQQSYYEQMGVNVFCNCEVRKIEPERKVAILSNGKQIKYDRLLIATGASPRPLGCKGDEKIGISGFRDIDDVLRIKERFRKSEKAFVFGGGLIGIKAGYALKKLGLDVEIIVKSKQIFSRVVNEEAAKIIAEHFQNNGIKIRTGLAPVEILGDKEMEGVLLDSGEKLKGQIGIVGKGVSPDKSFLTGSGIDVCEGVRTDERLRTNIENHYAAGDVAETKDIVSGQLTINAVWLNAQEQGYVAGINMAGGDKNYPGSVAANSAEFFGLPFISMGIVRESGDCEILEMRHELMYKRFVLKNNKLIGAVFVGDVSNAGFYMALLRTGIDLGKYKRDLGRPWFNVEFIGKLLESKQGLRESISLEGEQIFFK